MLLASQIELEKLRPNQIFCLCICTEVAFCTEDGFRICLISRPSAGMCAVQLKPQHTDSQHQKVLFPNYPFKYCTSSFGCHVSQPLLVFMVSNSPQDPELIAILHQWPVQCRISAGTEIFPHSGGCFLPLKRTLDRCWTICPTHRRAHDSGQGPGGDAQHEECPCWQRDTLKRMPRQSPLPTGQRPSGHGEKRRTRDRQHRDPAPATPKPALSGPKARTPASSLQQLPASVRLPP